LIADAFFFVNASPPNTPFPILVRLYWSPSYNRWVPDDLILGSLDTFDARYPIF
jgi:hypothetical protein